MCPVDIDLPRMLLDLRHDLVEEGYTEGVWDVGMGIWSRGVRSPRLFSLAGRAASLGAGALRRAPLPPPLSGWTRYRNFPRFAPRSFHRWWAERRETEAADE